MKIDFNDITELAQGTAMDIWGPREPAKLIEKLKEEVAELEEAWDSMEKKDEALQTPAKFDVMKELGDVLFCVVRFAHNIGVSPRDALALTIVKIQEREKFGIAKKTSDRQLNLDLRGK